MKNQKINKLFREIVKSLNQQNIIPFIYGSFGLSLLLKDNEFKIEDLDFFVHNKKEFLICQNILLNNGFEKDPKHSREMIKRKTFVSFLDVADIEKLLNEKILYNLEITQGVCFYNLQLKQYLKIYENGLKNKYRQSTKGKIDLEKINMIKAKL